ncbi:hypothetical protein FG167_16680 [Lacinutrix sp. WUR7]|uniref:hypothetical protein n=1 Tax=Lacinutrix sp. WUR7 TaxID=2653681 RepID=UPI00193C8C26|nr:hypothetical protein [Lacinutrix sp. WUR7]QRM90807.1 hypothetical protein FG167_16680 [Lacinutrix sp. WUR7]
MKKFILGLILIGLTMQSYGQGVLFQAKIKKDKVPGVIIEAIDTDFGDFEMTEFYAIPIEFIEEEVYVNRNMDAEEDYETYQVILKGKNSKIVTTYNKEGELLSTVEHFKNTAPNLEVRNAMAKAFPGWLITKDHYKLTHYSGKQKKERFKFIITKGKEKKVVFMDGKGEILKVQKKLNLELKKK